MPLENIWFSHMYEICDSFKSHQFIRDHVNFTQRATNDMLINPIIIILLDWLSQWENTLLKIQDFKREI